MQVRVGGFLTGRRIQTAELGQARRLPRSPQHSQAVKDSDRESRVCLVLAISNIAEGVAGLAATADDATRRIRCLTQARAPAADGVAANSNGEVGREHGGNSHEKVGLGHDRPAAV
jgi:hypothetical protein